MLTRSTELQKLLISHYATSVYKIEVGPSFCFSQTPIYSVRQDYFKITCAIHLHFFKKIISSKFLTLANAEVHNAEFGLKTIKLKVFQAYPQILQISLHLWVITITWAVIFIFNLKNNVFF